MDFDINAVIANFQVECEEFFQSMEEALLELERNAEDAEQIATIFRIVHTIKGNAAALEMPKLGAFAHALEDVLGSLRDGTVKMTSPLCSAMLRTVDALRQSLAAAISENELSAGHHSALLEELSGLMQRSQDIEPLASAESVTFQQQPHLAGHQTLRVKLESLDSMMDLAGEIAIAQSRLERVVQEIGDAGKDALEIHQELGRLFLNLQDHLLKVRMVPIQPLFQQFHRVVRDLGVASGKQARLVIENGDVEVDTSIAEHLKDALMHMVRNAMDHGLENEQERTKAGKPACGTITLHARHESGSICIQVCDDGAGFHREKILERARQKGLIHEQSRLSEQEIYGLVFQPGFSTSETVTDISGRGVGMDVVRRNVDALHGSIQVESRPGQGSTVHIRLPLTLAIIEGFTVQSGQESYVIPLDSVVECMEMPPDAMHSQDGGVINHHGTPLPFLRLREWFGFEPAATDIRENVLVVSYGDGKAGIAVDNLLGKGQAVIKPLGKLFQKTLGVAGSTILGDGRVALILDVPALVREAVTRQKQLVTQ